MPNATTRADAARAVIFSPLEGAGRAELVEQRLTDAIVAGVLRDGERLPSESDLAKFLGVAPVTAREALVALRHKGLVRTRRGRDGGSFVTYDRDASTRMLEERVRASAASSCATSRCTTPRSPAWPPRSPPTVRATTTCRDSSRSHARADLATPGGAAARGRALPARGRRDQPVPAARARGAAPAGRGRRPALALPAGSGVP